MSKDNDQNVNKIDEEDAKKKKANRSSQPKGKGNRQPKGGVDSKSLFGRGSFASIKINADELSVVHRLPSDPKIMLEERISLGGISLDPQVIALVKALNQMLRPGFDPNRKTPIRVNGKVELDEKGKPTFHPTVADILVERLKNPHWDETQEENGYARYRNPSLE